ncbi:MAG: tetraacyldisaccharide 4'-kinase [Candidatus Solibacter usitatus]|nr:tetraacyldisaccharide 4'-kinase [Candidatus Solibacter usitatus]
MIIYFLYRLLGLLAFPLIVLYLVRRGLRDRRYWQRLGERFGFAPHLWNATVPGGIWLHAVSVGEIVSAVELIRQMRAEMPGRGIYVSVTTVAGRQIAEEKLGVLADGIFYAPLDLCWAVRSVLRRLRPRVVVVMETEIWPNLFREAKRFGCGLVVVNGRISDKALPRYRRARRFFRQVLCWPDLILVQNEQARLRYLQIGAPEARVRVSGNLKYDFRAGDTTPPADIAALLEKLRPEPVWIAASTMPPAIAGDPDEDDVVIQAFRDLSQPHPRLLLILVPRRPERFDEAAGKLREAGVSFLRRSQLTVKSDARLPAVLLLDSMGELSSIFPLATVVFMGGTLPHRGGHNILEPAFFAKPMIIGPHMENFPDIAAEFRAQGGVMEIAHGDELAGVVSALCESAEQRRELGEKASALALSKGGATARACNEIVQACGRALPRYVHPWPLRWGLTPFTWAWAGGVRLDRRRKQQLRLPAPVISIGGITMGGAGKTPMAGYLAETLSRRGRRVAILTRGYKRAASNGLTILTPGEECAVERTGDEAQILLREGNAALGIGADRHRAGLLLQEHFHPDLFLLDDGLQHWRLAKDCDIVMIDALDPFGRDAIFPLGRLREPLAGLQRASAFVIMRAAPPLPWSALETRLRTLCYAPIFYATLEGVEWVGPHGETHPPDYFASRNVSAFCGLGNPAAFWETLARLGIRPARQWTFADHTSYRLDQIHKMTDRAGIVLTTQKDALNLPTDVRGDVYWLRTKLLLRDEEKFHQWLTPFYNVERNIDVKS